VNDAFDHGGGDALVSEDPPRSRTTVQAALIASGSSFLPMRCRYECTTTRRLTRLIDRMS
jgi:hypothetical protein